MPASLPGLHALTADFDDFLVDIWGVIHDGERPFAGTIDALARLAQLETKRVLFVTNTSRTSDAVEETLTAKMGIDRSLFFGVVSSGDVTQAAIRARDPAVFHALPPSPRCFHSGDASFVPWLFELGLTMVEAIDEAELIVASGAPRDATALDEARLLLAPAIARNVPLVCTNPDRVIPTAKGLGIGPGAIAHAYATLGGRTFLYGKPHAPIYDEARRRLGSSRRVIAIGDLLETDILGAKRAGIPSMLVTRGETFDASRSDVMPDIMIERFAW